METEQPPGSEKRSWGSYMLLVLLAAGMVFGLQLAEIALQSGRDAGPSPRWSELLAGDYLVKRALAGVTDDDPKDLAKQAIERYDAALPWPAAYRRIGLTRELILGKPGRADLDMLASPEVVKELTTAQAKKLTAEAAMWREILSARRLSPGNADVLVRRIEKLNLGPLKYEAVAEVYRLSGRQLKADTTAGRASADARFDVLAASALIALFSLAAVIGLALATRFLARRRDLLRAGPVAGVRVSALTRGFVAYLIGTLATGTLLASVLDDFAVGSNDMLLVASQAVAVLCGLAVGLWAMAGGGVSAREQLHAVGLRAVRLGCALRWGIGGCLAALPFICAASIVTQHLTRTVFRNVQTPEQPFGPVFALGSAAGAILVLLLAAVIAPAVEEVFFRGALYTALRARLRVWPSALLSAAVFAIGHPLPGGFLIILVLGVVLAVIRESTGSVVPSMVCHSIYNTGALIVTRFMF